MSDSQAPVPMAGGQTSGSCERTGFQVVCLEADVDITASAVPMTPVVSCINEATIVPLGTEVCARTETPCGFTISQQLCVEVPVTFAATAAPTATRQFCGTPSEIACNRPCPFFEPKSQGFFSTHFNLTEFSATDICTAAECVRANSSFFDAILIDCPAPGTPCPSPDTAACAAQITTLETQAGSLTQIDTLCPPPTPGANGDLAATLRQLLAVLLDVCLCTTTTLGVPVGGVLLTDQVDLSGFSAADLALLGLNGPCETVGNVVSVANTILSSCDRTRAGLIAPILAAMAQDAGITIIRPFPCP